MSLVGGSGLGASFGSVFSFGSFPCFLGRFGVVGFVGALVVFFLMMVWVGLGSVVVVFGWVISVAIVLRVRRVQLGRRGSHMIFQIFQPIPGTIAHFLDQRFSKNSIEAERS